MLVHLVQHSSYKFVLASQRRISWGAMERIEKRVLFST
jgi:hypothetical protein